MRPWSWIPTLYFTQGLPNVIVVTLSVVMYKRLGISNAEIALYTAWLHLPWVIKPLWGPVVDMLRGKRWWIIATQLLTGAALAGVALALPGPAAFRHTLAFLWLLAFSSATHDIAADGFYMLALDEKRQAYFVGWRNTFYRVAMLTGQGLLVVLAGYLEKRLGDTPRAWSLLFLGMAALLLLLALYHYRHLPRPPRDTAAGTPGAREYLASFRAFFRKPGILAALAFLLLYRLAEAQLVKMSPLFLLDSRADGGLGMSPTAYGLAHGTVGPIALTAGGIAGGILLARRGLRRCIWPMTLAMNLPDIAYLYLSVARPESPWIITACIAGEQLGYGFGFTAFTYFMIRFSDGPRQTAHYAICTGFMTLGLMLPGMASGWIQETLGYPLFFTWIMLCTLPAILVARLVARQ